jgi:hypothetical protein
MAFGEPRTPQGMGPTLCSSATTPDHETRLMRERHPIHQAGHDRRACDSEETRNKKAASICDRPRRCRAANPKRVPVRCPAHPDLPS